MINTRSTPAQAAAPHRDPSCGAPHFTPVTRAVDLDSTLIAVAAGSREAFAELYDAVAPAVFRISNRLLRDGHQAEEVTQEIFLEIWQHAPRFDPARGRARAWILLLARSRAVDRVRVSQSTRIRDTSYSLATGGRAYDSTSEAAVRSCDGIQVRRHLDCLTRVQRQVIDLAYFQELTNSEIAAHLNVPVSTIKTRLRDALIRLRASQPDFR